jgi:hypothetical protein
MPHRTNVTAAGGWNQRPVAGLSARKHGGYTLNGILTYAIEQPFNGSQGAPVRPIMNNSAFACSGCHQR